MASFWHTLNHGFNEHAVPWPHDRVQINALMSFTIKNDSYFELAPLLSSLAIVGIWLESSAVLIRHA